MASIGELNASVREKSGTGEARAVRRDGRVPGIIYGDDKPPMAIALDAAELRQRIYAGRFLTTVYDLKIDGTTHRVIPRDYQLHPVKEHPMHVDFLRLGEGATIRVNIPVHVLNTEISPGVKRGGAVNIVTHSVEARCPADAIPNSIDVDLSGLDINHSVHLNDIQLPPNVKPIVTDLTLVTIVPASGFKDEQRAAKDGTAPAEGAAAADAKAPAAKAPAAKAPAKS